MNDTAIQPFPRYCYACQDSYYDAQDHLKMTGYYIGQGKLLAEHLENQLKQYGKRSK